MELSEIAAQKAQGFEGANETPRSKLQGILAKPNKIK